MPTQKLPARSWYSACALLFCSPGRVALVEHRELHAVEAHEAPLGAEPDVSVARLEDRLDRVLRQARVGLPDLVRVLRDRFSGIEGREGQTEKEPERDETDRAARSVAPATSPSIRAAHGRF